MQGHVTNKKETQKNQEIDEHKEHAKKTQHYFFAF